MEKYSKNKVMWLALDGKDFISKKTIERGVITYSSLKGKCLFLRVLRRFHLNLPLPFKEIWYGDWKYNLKTPSTIIIYASKPAIQIAYYIKKRTNAKLIFLYMNIAKTTVNPDTVPSDICEKFSFDENDCKKYNMKYNTQFYFKDISLPKLTNRNDVTFIGADKGRYDQLINLKDQLNKKGILTYFHITSSKRIHSNEQSRFEKRISYEKILHIMSESRVIIDYVQDGQVGLTRRPLEALFLSKKLITNDKGIKYRDFYNKENIFILDEDDFDKINEFIFTQFVPIDKNILVKYDFDSWIDRFLQLVE